MAPFVVGKTVFVGNSGGEMGVRGWLAALDVDTGKELWRAYSTGTDEEVKHRAGLQAVLRLDEGQGPGRHHLAGRACAGRAPARCGAGSRYDPAAQPDLLRHQQSRARACRRSGPATTCGPAPCSRATPTPAWRKWAYQFTPHDQWDYDGVNENVLIDIPWQGKPRKVLVHFDRNGFALHDRPRRPARCWSAQPFAYQNWANGHRPEDGQPIVNPAMAAEGRT